MLKAAAGGGGKGMRRIDGPDDLPGAYRAARSEAAASFGDDAVYMEKYIVEPRHVEIQVLGDSTRPGGLPGGAGVLAPAAPPEGGRGGAVAGGRPGAAAPHGRGGGPRGRGGRLHQRRDGRVPARRVGGVLLPGDEHPPPGRAPGHRAGHRRRPGGASRSGSPRASPWGRRSTHATGSSRAATPSRSGSTPRARTGASRRRRAGSTCSGCPRGPACATTAASPRAAR